MGASTSTSASSSSPNRFYSSSAVNEEIRDGKIDPREVAGACRSRWNPAEELIADLRRLLLETFDQQYLAGLSYGDFAEQIIKLNQLCRQLVDRHGKCILFAVRKGSADSQLWKSTVRIVCLKVVAVMGRVEASKVMTLSQFLKTRDSLVNLICSSQDGDDLKKPSCSKEKNTKENLEDCGASMVLERFESVVSDDLNLDCVICMERKPDVILPCTHSYCLPCIEQWSVSKHFCPTCREALANTDDAWVIADVPSRDELSEYLLSLTDK